MVQLEGFGLISFFLNPKNAMADGMILAINKVHDLAIKVPDDKSNKIANVANRFKIDEFIKSLMGSGIMLTNNELKVIIKVIRSLENREILMKGTTRNINIQKGEIFNFLAPLMKVGLPLMKNIFIPLAKIVLVPLGLTASASATDAAIQKNIFASETTPIISDEEMYDIMKIVKSLEESGLLIKGVSETIKNESREQKGKFIGMLLDTLAASFLGSALAGKGVIRGSEGVIRTYKEAISTSQA